VCTSARALALASLAVLPACLASSVVDASARAVEVHEDQRAWRTAEPGDLTGLFESVRLEGEAAAALWKVYYHFASDGTYTGAALVFDGERAQFQTLSGTWSLAGGRLEIDGADDSRASVSGGDLRVEGAAGTAYFRRAAEE
jgi:hypothetical protein